MELIKKQNCFMLTGITLITIYLMVTMIAAIGELFTGNKMMTEFILAFCTCISVLGLMLGFIGYCQTLKQKSATNLPAIAS